MIGTVQDVTERVAAEEELEARVRHSAAIVALSRSALAGGDLTELMQSAVDLVRETLEVHVAAISERLPDGTFVVPRVQWFRGQGGGHGRS